MPPATRQDQLARPHHVVTAVLVAHDGARWLPTTLAAVKSQRRPVQRFVAVDTGSHDETRDLLERAVGASSVLAASHRTGFSAAAHMAVSAFATAPAVAVAGSDGRESVEWIWLLHDDSAPAPDALHRLLELADEMPSAAIIGPKLRGWDDRRVLLEVGITVDRGGRRETGLEQGELDHGQHDGVREVLAVSTAGMLVRRDAWQALGGFDRALPLFRDDLDFGWRANLAGYAVVVCSRAVVYHAEAAASGQRRIHATAPFHASAASNGDAATTARRRDPNSASRRPDPSPASRRRDPDLPSRRRDPDLPSRRGRQPSPSSRRRRDRRAALYTLLVNAAPLWLPWIALRLVLACLLRSVAFVLIKRPVDAFDELAAMVAVFGRPLRLLRARRVRAPKRTVSSRDISSLLAPRGSRFRNYAESFGQRLAVVGAADDRDQRGLIARVATQPGVVLVAALLVISLIAERHVLTGALYGGALLPAPTGASDLWRTYTESWHATGLGSWTPTPPYVALLAVLATVLFGSARLAVQVLLLGAVPLAGLVAYVSARRLVPQRRLRVWLAAVYALLPVATGAVATGRLGTCVAVIMLPAVLTAAARALLPVLVPRYREARQSADAGTDAVAHLPEQGGLPRAMRTTPVMRPAWAAAIAFTVGAVFDPALYVLLAPVFVVALVVGIFRRSGRAVARAAALLAVPPVLAMPWTPHVVDHPALLATGLGQSAPGLQADRLDPLSVLLLHPGGPGTPPTWLFAVVVLAGFAGLLRRTRPWPALLGWTLAVVGIAGGVWISSLSVQAPGAPAAVPGWPGTATALAAAGVLISAAMAGTRLRARLAAISFGWRQPVAVVVALGALATPVVAGALWVVRGTGPLLRAGATDVLPAFVTDPAASGDQPRTVVLRSDQTPGQVDYAVLRDRSPALPDADLPPDRAFQARFDRAVADLGGGFGDRAAAELAQLGVRYVLVRSDAPLNETIATAGGLVPKAGDAGWRVWEVNEVAGRLVIAGGADDSRELPETAGAVGRQTPPIHIAYSDNPRLLVLAEAPSPRWQAVAVGPDPGEHVPLPPTTDQGAQAFVLPMSQSADILVYRDDDRRGRWLIFELVATVLVLAAAVPAGRRAGEQRAVWRPDDVEPEPAEAGHVRAGL